MARWLSWALMALVLVVSLAVGVTGQRAARTESDRVQSIASGVRCPTCRSLSAAESDAKAAQAVRDEIRTRVRAGQSDAQIRGFLASRYGKDILLKPEATGLAGLVWAIPVALGIAALAGLVAAFRRWKREAMVEPSADDRALVEEALRS
jgi:cytochrome c-type biogenesis protein CcmH